MKIRETPSGVAIKVHVVPNASKFAIDGTNEWTGELKIKVKSAAREGGANKELVQELSKALGADVEIIQGHKSHTKVLLIKTDASRVRQLIP